MPTMMVQDKDETDDGAQRVDLCTHGGRGRHLCSASVGMFYASSAPFMGGCV